MTTLKHNYCLKFYLSNFSNVSTIFNAEINVHWKSTEPFSNTIQINLCYVHSIRLLWSASVHLLCLLAQLHVRQHWTYQISIRTNWISRVISQNYDLNPKKMTQQTELKMKDIKFQHTLYTFYENHLLFRNSFEFL